jgi:hypothetical protein
MPLFMDVHDHIEGLTAEAVAKAHRADLAVQGKYNVRILRYWFDERAGKVFCLIDARTRKPRMPCTARRTVWSPIACLK